MSAQHGKSYSRICGTRKGWVQGSRSVQQHAGADRTGIDGQPRLHHVQMVAVTAPVAGWCGMGWGWFRWVRWFVGRGWG